MKRISVGPAGAVEREKQQLDKTIEQAGRLGNQDKLHPLLQQRDRLKGQASEAERLPQHQSGGAGGIEQPHRGVQSPPAIHQLLGDHLPILLFPVRVETRFAPNRQPNNAKLWVRIYPDEATAHDPDLTDAEQTAANTFWFETWKATTEAEKLRSRTALVGELVRDGPPGLPIARNPLTSDKPMRRSSISTDAALLALGLTPAEQKAGKNYWRSTWFGNPADAVQTTLETAVGSGRATAVQLATQPTNWAEFQGKTPADEFARVVVLSQPNVLPGHEGQTASYAEVLPDQFVVIGYRDQRKVFELTGSAIPDRIWLSPNVSPLDGGISRDTDGQLQFDGDLAWMKDFDAAVNTGLGLRIDLRRAINRTVVTEQNGSQAAADAILRDVTTLGLTRLLVVGINAVDGADNGRVLLEKLFDNHHYGQTGLSFVPQGTPTNNTEGQNAGHRAEPAADESYALERGDPLFTDQPTAPFYQKANGQRMAEYLGIDSTVFQHLAHSADAELAEAQAMNVALYNATLAYYFDEMMDPLVSRADQHRIFQFFTQYVSARGSLPAMRVGRQPYGILPTTAIDHWKWTNEEVREGRQFAVPFHDKLVSLIQVFDRAGRLAKYPFRAGQGGQALAGKEQFLHMLGLEPTSVTYSQRWLYGRQFVRSFVYVLLGRDVSAEEMERWKKRAATLLGQLGITTEPALLSKTFADPAVPLKTVPLIDSLPLSETNPVQPLFTRADGTTGPNYLEWLRQSALTDIQTDNILNELGVKVAAPKTLLYALLQHAAEQSYWDTAMKLFEEYAIVNRTARREVELRHVATSPAGNQEARLWTKPDYLLADMGNIPQLGITGQTMSAYLSQRALLPILPDSNLHLVKESTGQARKTTHRPPRTALCRAYRPVQLPPRWLAQWPVAKTPQLPALRLPWPERTERQRRPKRGLSGCVRLAGKHQARPNPAGSRTQFPAELKSGGPVFEAANEGSFIHAPSLPQAVTAALLRSGYLAHASREAGSASGSTSTYHRRGYGRPYGLSTAFARGRSWPRCWDTSSSAACTTPTSTYTSTPFASSFRSRSTRPTYPPANPLRRYRRGTWWMATRWPMPPPRTPTAAPICPRRPVPMAC